jgi:hypothetical protein
MYRIEIYRYNHRLEETYETNDIEVMLFWYRDQWRICIERGSCYFYLYRDDKKLTFTETKELGFYDEID